MKLKTYIKLLKKLEAKYGDSELFYAVDDEGNGYDQVKFGPSICFIDKNNISVSGSVDAMDVHETKDTDKEVPIVIIN